MSYKLIIVESPEKAKVISTFLGNEFKVVASKGHVVDLPQKEFGIKKESNRFVAGYEPSPAS